MEPTRISLRTRRSAALAVVAAAAALAIPSAAGAAVTGTVTGDTAAALTGDGAPDTITIGVTGPNLSHNTLAGFESAIDFDSAPGVQALLSTATLTINSGGGNDAVTSGPNDDTIDGGAGDDTINGGDGDDTINGGDGDDTINGGAGFDTISGGDGNDRLTGGPGGIAADPEPISGGNGNDVIIWANGDGFDLNDGEGGVDETLITNGAADDQMSVAPLAGGRTLFHRVNNEFSVNMGTVEKLSIASFAGDDKLATAPGVTVPMTIDAGPGDDDITTGDASDRIVGDRGNDTIHAGAGDDTMAWSNGDGDDEMNGQDGLDRIENNLGGADDVSQISVLNGKVHYARTNAPFTLDVATSEVFELNTFGGNDTLDVGPGVGALIAITADAGSGDDRLNGNDEADTFFGGLGNDTLEPGAGADAVDGQAGDDTLRIRDGAGDLARGGAGTDSAIADAVDVLADVEHADVPPAADTQGTAVKVLSRSLTSKLKRGRYTARIRIECPAAEAGGCRGALVLLTAKQVRIGGVKVQALLGSKSYSLRAGQRKTLSIKLPKGVSRFARNHKLALRAQTVSRDAAGNVATGAKRITVKLVKPKQ